MIQFSSLLFGSRSRTTNQSSISSTEPSTKKRKLSIIFAIWLVLERHFWKCCAELDIRLKTLWPVSQTATTQSCHGHSGRKTFKFLKWASTMKIRIWTSLKHIWTGLTRYLEGLLSNYSFYTKLNCPFQVMDVVLITERYAESVLLMRKKLCMNLLDLFQPPTKVHSHDEFEFSDKQKMNFYEFQKLDLHMYNVRISHFSSIKLQLFSFSSIVSMQKLIRSMVNARWRLIWGDFPSWTNTVVWMKMCLSVTKRPRWLT